MSRLYLSKPCAFFRYPLHTVLAGAVGELVAETKIVVSTDGRQRSDVRGCQTREHVLEITQVRELNDVSEQDDQIDASLGEPGERRVRALIQVLGLEDVDPA